MFWSLINEGKNGSIIRKNKIIAQAGCTVLMLLKKFAYWIRIVTQYIIPKRKCIKYITDSPFNSHLINNSHLSLALLADVVRPLFSSPSDFAVDTSSTRMSTPFLVGPSPFAWWAASAGGGSGADNSSSTSALFPPVVGELKVSSKA